MSPPKGSGGGARHHNGPRPTTAENPAVAKLQVPDQCPTSARQRQARRALSAVSTDAELLESAAAHVQCVRQRCPQARALDPAVHLAAVVAHLQPLAPDRSFRRPAPRCRRGEAVWVGGAVGLHVPRAREAS